MNLTKREHLPTLSMSAFWFWIVLFVLLCGCGTLFVTMVPIFPKPTVAPPRVLPTQPPQTETPEPTSTSAPSPTAQLAPVTAKVIEDKVNLRAAPNTQATITGKLNKGDQITLIGRTNDSQWYQSTIAGKTQRAWVFGATVQIVSGDPKTLPVVNAP